MSAIAPSKQTYAREVENTDTLRGCAALFFRFPTPRVLALKILAFIIARPFLDPLTYMDAVFVGAVVIWWPFQEWLLHWKMLHFKPFKLGPFTIDPYMSKKHRYHHRHPWLLETTFLPTESFYVLVPLHIGLWWWLSPTQGLAATGIIAFATAALIYEWVHYLTHTPYRPRSAYYRWIWRNHRLHHFKNEHYWHSFTAPFLDVALGTGPSAKSVETSDTCLTLGVDDEF